MSEYSKRVKLHPNVLMEYKFNSTNYYSEDYKVLYNLKEKNRSFMSTSTINNQENSLFQVDSLLKKYAVVDTTNFNFLRVLNYSSSPIQYDTIKIYFPSGFDFNNDFLGFYVRIYTMGYNNNTEYSISNFHYIKSNTDNFKIFTLPVPFYYDEKYWVKSIEFDIPSINSISSQRLITSSSNTATEDSLNRNLSFGEGIAPNSPIFVDFSFITATQKTLGVTYYYAGDEFSISLPQTPEFTELGVEISESSNGDYFEIYATYNNSNENMDEFAYEEEIKGNSIKLEYVVTLYEENIQTSTQTYQVTNNFTEKILFRPIIQFSNTTAAIDVELKIVNITDSSYISKFGSLGITKSINKYGLKLMKLNMEYGVNSPIVYNKIISNSLNIGSAFNITSLKNTTTNISNSISNSGGSANSTNTNGMSSTNSTNTNGMSSTNGTTSVDVMKIPYPILVDKHRVLCKSMLSTDNTVGYTPNGILEILITSFDTVLQFFIAQDINKDGNVIPYDLSTILTNAKLLLVFKSDTAKLEKEPYYEANYNYSTGNISFKINESDYTTLRKIYNRNYRNFYLIINSNGTNTQLYSGKFLFYEDVTFINKPSTSTTSTTNPTSLSSDVIITTSDDVISSTNNVDAAEVKVDSNATNNNPFNASNMENVNVKPTTGCKLMVYVKFKVNMDAMDVYIKKVSITPDIQYGNVYYFSNLTASQVEEIKKQTFVDKAFDI